MGKKFIFPIKKAPGRRPAKEPFAFQELLPLCLKDQVSAKGSKKTDVACLHEMSIVFACLKKHDFNQSLCSSEIENFQKCYVQFTDNKKMLKEQDKKGIPVPGEKNLSYRQINTLLKKYPQPK